MNILMINQDQFGYKAGYFHYCKHLISQGHKIIYLCNDHGLNHMELEGVEVIYVYEPSSVKWRKKFIAIIKELKHNNTIDIALCAYFRGCSAFKSALNGIPTIIDIRSGDVSQGKIKRNILNKIIKFEANRFSRIMILSESLARKLKLKRDSYDIIPLGADIICKENKEYCNINMLYVGTLQQRDIHKTIEGLVKFKETHKDTKITYDIIGFGTKEEEDYINRLIRENELTPDVTFHGRINYQHLAPFFKKCNLGIAFVPMTPYYDCQPSTKIYEYVLSGLYCIATNTYENRILVTSENGIICDDNADSFSNALNEYYEKNRTKLSSDNIRSSMLQYQWSEIVNKQLLRNFNAVIKKSKEK